MSKKIQNIIFILFVFVNNLVSAQKEDYNWVLSNGIKINFNQQPPEVTTDIPPFKGLPNCASMSDKNGNLLFYINQNKVYNFNHQVIFSRRVFNIHNQVNVVPYPGDTKKYFWVIFTDENRDFRLMIYTIDMNANEGQGAVSETHSFLYQNSTCAITRKGNSQDYWFIRIFDDRTEAYPLTDKGIINSPIISNLNIGNNLHEYKLSPDMTRIFLHDYYNVDVFDIDIQTGKTKNYRNIYTSNIPFIFEFSRNGEFIYIARQNKSNYETTISQFSTHSLNNETEFLNSEIVLLDTTLSITKELRDIQLAPDNKIYITFRDYYLWAIENIDSPAPACTVNPKSLWLKNKKSGTYLPNYFYYHINFNYLKSCNTISFNYLGVEAVAYLWDFGDSQTSTEPNPTHEYATAGTYTVTLTVTYNDNSTQTTTKDIEVVGKPEKPVIEHE